MVSLLHEGFQALMEGLLVILIHQSEALARVYEIKLLVVSLLLRVLFLGSLWLALLTFGLFYFYRSLI